MSGLHTLLRASRLVALLCSVAALLEHAHSGSSALTQLDLADQALTRCAPPAAHAQWIASHAVSDSPSDSQTRDLRDSHADSEIDDGDDFDDALSHAHLELSRLGFGVTAQKRAVSRAREHMRREDRRCDKPPRARRVAAARG
jgi:hypothetical protein